MAEGESGDSSDKTEAPTQRRLERARDEGQSAVSREAVALGLLVAGTGAAALTLPAGGGALLRAGHRLLESAHTLDPATALTGLAGPAALLLLPVALAAAGGAILASLAQTGPRLRAAALAPDPKRLDPLAALKRLLGADGAIELLRTLFKLAVIGAALWAAIEPDRLLHALDQPAGQLAREVDRGARKLFSAGLAAFAVIALLDLVWVRWRHVKTLRMSRHDLREEQRESEGDPQIKARLRRLRESRARRRMLAAVPKAAVVVTNPTHYAIALSYDGQGGGAPRLVAKGVDAMAARIRAKAEEHGVPLIADPPLARALWRLELDTEIPAEHWQAVAEILAYVFKLQGRAPGQPRA